MVTWTEEDLRNYERKFKGYTNTHGSLNPKASALVTQLSDPIPKQARRSEPVQSDEVKEGGKERFKVSITRYGSRLLDADNLAGAKLLIDELRYAGYILNDDPSRIDLELKQGVVCKENRGTLIEITPIP